MARITVEDCMSKIDNQYDLVLLAKERTAQLNAGAQMLVPEENDKKTIISLREIMVFLSLSSGTNISAPALSCAVLSFANKTKSY